MSIDMHFASHRTIKLISANDNPRSPCGDRTMHTADRSEHRPGSMTLRDAVRQLIAMTANGGSIVRDGKRAAGSFAVWSGKVPLRIMARARSDLTAIHRYTIETHSENRGHAYLRALEAALDLLATHPSLGRMVDERVRRFVSGKHVVLYRIVVGVIVIDRIFHGAQRQ